MIGSAVAAGILRSYFLVYLERETWDSLWFVYKIWIWTFIELYVAIAAASAPALKPFFLLYLIQPVMSQVSRRLGSHGHGPEDYYGAGTDLQGVSDAEKGDVSWSQGSSMTPDLAIDADVTSDEKIGVAHEGSDDPGPYEMETFSSAKAEAARVARVRPVLPPPPRFPSPDAAPAAEPGGGSRWR